MQNSSRLRIITAMSMHIAILAFVASFTAITGWLIIRAPAKQTADHAEIQPPTPTPPPTGNEVIQESEPASDEVIALSDSAQSVRSMLNETIIPDIDLDNATLEEAMDHLRLLARENDPQLNLSFIIRRPRISSTDSLSPEMILSDKHQITIYEKNITLTKALNLICLKGNYRWKNTEHGILLTPLN